eukprot:12897234-Prorocentrum_lima.AAC.1
MDRTWNVRSTAWSECSVHCRHRSTCATASRGTAKVSMVLVPASLRRVGPSGSSGTTPCL